MKDEMHVSPLPRGIIIGSILAPPNISAGEPLSNADTPESLTDTTCVYLHFAACYHYVQRLHCAKTVVVVVCRAFAWTCRRARLLLIISPPCFPPPPGSEASLGNSLNTSEEELHTAGITLAPKGSGTSHQPISIQIAPARALIAITFALIAIAATRTSSTFD